MMCGDFCIWFFDFILKGKRLLDYTNLFSPNKYEKSDILILKQFLIIKQVKVKEVCSKKYTIYFWKNVSSSIIYSKCCNEDEKIFKEEEEEESSEILKFLI